MSAISLNVLHSDKWEQFKIKDIAQIGRGRVISSIEIGQQKSPTYPVYSSQTSNDGIMGYLDDYMFEGEYISWTTDGANAGTVFYRNGKFNCTNVCGLLKLRKEFDTHFVSLVLAEATKKYVSINLANPKLMNNTMGNIQIRLPKLEEQKEYPSFSECYKGYGLYIIVCLLSIQSRNNICSHRCSYKHLREQVLFFILISYRGIFFKS